MNDITNFDIFGFLLILVFGLVLCIRPMLIPFFHRSWMRLHKQLTQAADRQEALSDSVVSHLVSSAKEMSVISGLIMVFAPLEEETDESKESFAELEQCIERHSWVLPYLWQGHCLVSILRWLGQPYKPGYAFSALKSAFSLLFLMRPEGGISYIGNRSRSALAFIQIDEAVREAVNVKGNQALAWDR